MKTIFTHFTLITSLIFSLTSCQKSEKKHPPLIAITQIIDHQGLNLEREGFLKGLEEAGFIDGKNIQIIFESAQGNIAMSAQIAQKFISQDPSIIVALSTPSAQSVLGVIGQKKIPLVFSAVTDPVSAKLVSFLEKNRKENVTGVSDKISPKSQVDLIKRFCPFIKAVGIIYNSGEVNSVQMVNEFKKEADLVGLTVVESVALKTSDVSSASKHLVGKVDAIYIPNDNTAVSAMSSITQVGVDNKIPVFVGDVAFEKEATAIAGFDRFKLGKKLASVVIRILNGEEASSIPVEVDHPVKVILNKTNANRIGLSFSQEQLKDVSVIE